MNILKILGFLFALLMVYSTFLNYKRKEFNKIQVVFWELMWVALILVVIFTNIVTKAIREIGFIRLMDFLTVAGFIIITLLSFYNYSSISKINKKIERLTREETLKDVKNNES